MSTDFSAIGTACGTQTDCIKRTCDGTGKCVPIPAPLNTSCILPTGMGECQTAVCDGNGTCVAIPRNDVPCSLDEAIKSNRTLALCHNAICHNGTCVAVPLVNGVNCTHRLNDSDLEERICQYSVCSKGMCIANGTVPACNPWRSDKGKIGIIVGAIGGAAILLAAAAIGKRAKIDRFCSFKLMRFA